MPLTEAERETLLSRAAVTRATDSEIAVLVKHFARLGDLSQIYPGSAAPEPFRAGEHDVQGHWVTWRLDGIACCLLQQRRSAGQEPAPLYLMTRDRRLFRLRTAAKLRRVVPGSDGLVTYPSTVLEGVLTTREGEAMPLFVATQCLWTASGVRFAEDAQTRMADARTLVEAAPVNGVAAQLQRVDEHLDFIYKPHQTPTQARSVLARPPPPVLARLTILGVEARPADGRSGPHRPSEPNGVRFASLADAERLVEAVRAPPQGSVVSAGSQEKEGEGEEEEEEEAEETEESLVQ